MTRYVLLGTGVAGISAAEAIRSIDMNSEIIFIGEDPHGYYSRPGLAYYLTGELPDDHLYCYPPHAYQKLNAKFVRGQATRILVSEHAVDIDGGKSRLSYDRLLIAVGSSAVRLTVPGADLEGVVKLDHMEDAKCILKFAKRGKTAVVVGGGITALEIVEGLIARRVRTHYLLRGDRYWGNVLDEAESGIVEHKLREDGVNIHFNVELVEILGKNGRVNAVRLENGEIIKCDILAAAIGIAPRTELGKAAGIKVDRGILVDEYMQTNAVDVFAAGDVAQAIDLNTGKYVLDSLWNPAREQGFTAGLNMAGKKTVYRKSAPFNVTRLAGLTTTIIGSVGAGRDSDVVGIVRGESETWHEIPDAIIAQNDFDVNHLRLMISERHIIGAIVMGDQTLSIPLQQLVIQKVDISSIRPALLTANAPIGEIVAGFWADHLKQGR
jgi:NAD(P)H-nitrite reductase large subunit